MRFCKSFSCFQHSTYQTPSNGSMICCELLLKTLCPISDHPATSDPQRWFYKILKTLEMLLESNMSDPLKWLDDIFMSDPRPSSYLRPPDMALWDAENSPNVLASNILDPLKWLDDMLWTLPENPMSDPWPSSYLRPPEMALWDTANPPNILSIQFIRPPQMARWYVVNSSCEPYIGS